MLRIQYVFDQYQNVPPYDVSATLFYDGVFYLLIRNLFVSSQYLYVHSRFTHTQLLSSMAVFLTGYGYGLLFSRHSLVTYPSLLIWWCRIRSSYS